MALFGRRSRPAGPAPPVVTAPPAANDPQPDASVARGLAELEAKRYTPAIAAFDEALSRDGGHLVALYQVGSSRVDLQACKLEYSIVSPK